MFVTIRAHLVVNSAAREYSPMERMGEIGLYPSLVKIPGPERTVSARN